MKMFDTIQNRYEVLGISPSNQWTQKLSFNGRVQFGFTLFGYVFASQFVYTFLVANGFMEYMECTSSILAGFVMFMCFVAIVLRRTLLFETIGNAEKILDTSKPNFIL